MKSYRTLALKELLSQKVTSILILIAVVLSTMMTTIVGQSIGVLSAMREQQAIAIGGNRYATFLQMNADQLHALEQDERLSYVGKSIYMGSLELSPSLTLGLMEYLDDTAAIYPSSTSIEEGRLPEAPMEIALSEDILKYLGFEGGIGDKITLSLQKNLRHNIADSYSYTAEFVLTGILKNNYLGYTSGTVTGVVGEGTAEQLLTESYIYYNVDIRTADKKNFQAVVDDINKEFNIHELDTSYNIVYLNALGISYTANSEGANDKGFSFMTVAGILVGTLILLAAGLVIYNILKISVSKRIKGYGTLRAIGGEKGQLYQIIVIEVILLCLMGIPIGMLLGFLSARGILEAATGLVSPELFLVQDASELKTLIAENSSLNGTLLVLSGAITLAFALFAALPAARSAARVSPIMAMSGTNLKIRRRKRKTKKIHNFEAYYARLNLKRNKGRTAITILSLVMSITVFIALQGFSSLLNAASALQDNHVGDYQITNESIGFTTDDLNTLRKNEAVQSVAAIQFSLYEQNENGLLDEISLEFQLKPGETFQVVGLNDEYWDYFMGDQLPEEQLGQLKAGNACIVRNPIPMSYGEDVLEFTNIEAGENICVAGMELNVLKTLDGYDGYLGIGNGGFTNGVQVIVDDAIYERLTGKDTYSEFLPTLNEGADRENFDTFIEAFCNRIPGTTFLSYEESDQQLKESFAQIQMLAWGLILFVGLIGILSECYSRDMSLKTKSAKYAKMRRGEYQSVICPYGYRKSADGRMEPDEDVAPNVQMIFQWASEGNTAAEITRKLYAMNIPTPGEYRKLKGKAYYNVSRTNGVWSTSTVLRILEDQRYIGTYVIGKRKVKEIGSRHTQLKDESEWFKIPNHHPAIVSVDLFEKANASIKRFSLSNKKPRDYLLRGKVFCGCCDHAMSLRNGAWFYCRHSEVAETLPCHGVRIKMADLEQVVFETIRAQMCPALGIDSNKDKLDLQTVQQTEHEEKLRSIQDSKRYLYEQYALGEIDLETYRTRKAVYDTELVQAKNVHAVITAQTKQIKSDYEIKLKQQEIVQEVGNANMLTKALIDRLINKVYVFPGDRIEIEYATQDFLETKESEKEV